MKLELLERMLAMGRAGVPTALATNLKTGAQRLVVQEGAGDSDASPLSAVWDGAGDSDDLPLRAVYGEAGDSSDLSLSAEELAKVRQAVHDDRSTTIETEAGLVFVEVHNSALRLFVIGAVHTAQALVPLARLAGYQVTVIDPRTAFNTAARFPGIALNHEWPDKALAALKPDRRTAVVTLTHDPKIDDPALRTALRSEAFYIGALGSRRTHAKRTQRLIEAGFDAEAIARVRGPVGLAIGAITPGEIAISIMAEITAVLRRAALAVRAV